MTPTEPMVNLSPTERLGEAMRALLVEDDPTTAKSIEMMLKSAGMVVDATDLGEDGLEIGKLYDYDIIILDLMLPDIDGMEVLRRLRDSGSRRRS